VLVRRKVRAKVVRRKEEVGGVEDYEDGRRWKGGARNALCVEIDDYKTWMCVRVCDGADADVQESQRYEDGKRR